MGQRRGQESSTQHRICTQQMPGKCCLQSLQLQAHFRDSWPPGRRTRAPFCLHQGLAVPLVIHLLVWEVFSVSQDLYWVPPIQSSRFLPLKKPLQRWTFPTQ